MKVVENNTIRIRLRSYTHYLLTESCKTIINTANITNTKFSGAIALPTKRKLYCVLRSPHVNKDSREHFEIRCYTRIIDIHDPSSQTIDSLMKLNIPAGVDIEIRL